MPLAVAGILFASARVLEAVDAVGGEDGDSDAQADLQVGAVDFKIDLEGGKQPIVRMGREALLLLDRASNGLALLR